jgi:hypothetical protein
MANGMAPGAHHRLMVAAFGRSNAGAAGCTTLKPPGRRRSFSGAAFVYLPVGLSIEQRKRKRDLRGFEGQ